MSEEIKVHFTNYIGTKCVNGFPMNKETYCKLRGWDVPADEDPLEEGYLVEYPDSKSNQPQFRSYPQFRGYISWSPKAAFEAAYRDVGKGCTFGHAIELLKSGFKLARKSWNGKGMYISYVDQKEWNSSVLERPWDEDLKPRPWIGIKTVDNEYMPWVPSQSDVLAEDWVLV